MLEPFVQILNFRSAKAFFVLALGVLAMSGCDDGSEPGMTVPQRDMFVRTIQDAAPMQDAIRLDVAMVLRECEEGETRPCGQTMGECREGVETCNEFGLWPGECVGEVAATDELCDERDNDCDGLIDELFSLGGTCKYTDDRGLDRDGRVYCQLDMNAEDYGQPFCRPETDCSEDMDGDGSGVCDDCDDEDPNNFPDNIERCDEADNDCDERVDESFDVGDACMVGEGICRSGGIRVCAVNGMETACQGEPGAPEDELCDGLDNDCDGNADEGFDLMRECTVGVGACVRPGVIACNRDGAAVCEGEPGVPGIEVCNETDDDCDMVVDEGLGLNDECTVGRGICERIGVNRCNPSGDGTVACSEVPGDPAEAEECNALDDDCDGTTDEGNPGGGAECNSGRPGRCGAGRVVCTNGGLVCRPNAAEIEEVCNGLDDDCDSSIDEVPGVGERCSVGTGACERVGAQQCQDGVGLVCNADPGQPVAEACNGIDDDCDGRVDENNPGAGGACETDQVGICRVGTLACVGGALACQSNRAPVDEVCNNDDDDCDGSVDEVPGVGDACSEGIGLCRVDGLRVCSPGVGLVCSANAGSPVAERCDGLDNDCDGRSDEIFVLNQPCEVGVGQCRSQGRTVCSEDQLATICEGQEGQVAVEVCDGLDNDCDSRVDEGNPEGGRVCDSGEPGRCQSGLLNCRAGVLECDREQAPIDEQCNDQDDDCDGNIDEAFDLGMACSEGVGGCREIGVVQCNEAQDGVSCSVTGGVPQIELCNDIDDDCDGEADEGFELGSECEDGIGICLARGRQVCNEDGLPVCDAEARPALAAELCNQLDDDCDGQLDEGNPEGGAACPVAAPGVCGIGLEVCSAGLVSCVPNVEPGDQSEICDAQDNDCDSSIDEGNPGGGQVCQTNNFGACRDGVTSCTGGFITCQSTTAPQDETCNAIDDDCDNTVDEDFDTLGDACDGDDADECANGVIACDPQTGGTLCANDLEIVETCDNRDNDCDGIVDNGFDKLNDVTNCGTCGRDCRDPNPLNPGFEYPNAACIVGTCFQTFYVDEKYGSNASGDGSEIAPWRTIAHALDGRIDSRNYAARLYVNQGRYSSDQWVDRPQCDGNGNGDSTDDTCITHVVACEFDGNPITVDRCTECVCDPALVCADDLCSLPESEREEFPILMQEKVQLVGNIDPAAQITRDHIVIDGGEIDCFINENGPECSVNRRPDGGELIRALDMADQDMQDRAQTCFVLDDPECMSPDDADFAFLSLQPNWSARGSRNLLANLTLLRGGESNDPALKVSSSAQFLELGTRTSLRITNVAFRKIRAAPGYPVGTIYDADVMLDRGLIQQSEGRSARALVLLNRTHATVENMEFYENNITEVGRGLLQASNSELNVSNSVFANNEGGGIYFHSDGHGSCFNSSFSRNDYYGVYVHSNAIRAVVVANNIFDSASNGGAHLYVDRASEASMMAYNNLLSPKPPGGHLSHGRINIGSIVTLNDQSWADSNVQALTRLQNPGANNLALVANSPAIDAATDFPVPLPLCSANQQEACTTSGPCDPADADCVSCTDIDARCGRWSSRALVCGEDGFCEVDLVLDTDRDTYPDWIEVLLAGYDYNDNPNQPDSNYMPELDRVDIPPYYSLPVDLEDFSRPSGPSRDQGAYEFSQ